MGERKELETVEKCETCRFWVHMGGELGVRDLPDGQCRRFPPQYSHFNNSPESWAEWYSPAVPGNHWCGEWQAPRGAESPRVPADPRFVEWLNSVRVGPWLGAFIERAGVSSFAELLGRQTNPWGWPGFHTGVEMELEQALRGAGFRKPSHWLPTPPTPAAPGT